MTPSPTALMSAAARAAHLVVDDPPPFLVDEQAAVLCRAASSVPLDYQLAAPREPVLAAARLSATVRSRFAEDVVRGSGVEQHVVLGAGLDTSAHRLDPRVTTWAVDLPGVLAWRSHLFVTSGIADPARPVPVDLTADDVLPALAAAGCDLRRPTAVSWLGVAMYLGTDEVARVLRGLAGLGAGSHLVVDHVLPVADRDEAGRSYADALSAAVGAAGEPWRSTLSPAAAAELLADAGWDVVASVAEADAVPGGLAGRRDGLRPQRLVQLTHAVTGG